MINQDKDNFILEVLSNNINLLKGYLTPEHFLKVKESLYAQEFLDLPSVVSYLPEVQGKDEFTLSLYVYLTLPEMFRTGHLFAGLTEDMYQVALHLNSQ